MEDPEYEEQTHHPSMEDPEYEEQTHIVIEYEVQHGTVNTNDEHKFLTRDQIKSSPFIFNLEFSHIYVSLFPNLFPSTARSLGSLLFTSYTGNTKVSISQYLSDVEINRPQVQHLLLETLDEEFLKLLRVEDDYLTSFKYGDTRKLLKMVVTFLQHYDCEECFYDHVYKHRVDHTHVEVVASLERVEVEALSIAAKKESCSICLEGLDAEKLAIKLPCKHVFHKGCIVKWLKRSCFCPVCRCKMPHSCDPVVI